MAREGKSGERAARVGHLPAAERPVGDDRRTSAERRQDGWSWVAEEVVSRRVALGFRQRADFARAAGLGLRTVGDIENARRTSYDRSTIAAVEHVLQWPAGTISRIITDAMHGNSGLGVGRRLEWDPNQLASTTEVVDGVDDALIRVMRSTLPDEKKRQIVRLLLAEREEFERQRLARAQDLIELLSDAGGQQLPQ